MYRPSICIVRIRLFIRIPLLNVLVVLGYRLMKVSRVMSMKCRRSITRRLCRLVRRLLVILMFILVLYRCALRLIIRISILSFCVLILSSLICMRLLTVRVSRSTNLLTTLLKIWFLVLLISRCRLSIRCRTRSCRRIVRVIIPARLITRLSKLSPNICIRLVRRVTFVVSRSVVTGPFVLMTRSPALLLRTLCRLRSAS